MSKSKPDLSKLSPETRLVAAGREYTEHGFVNPAVYHASTVLFPSVEVLNGRSQEYVYGRRGTPTSRAVEDTIAALEGGYKTKVCPSGMAAISTALLAFLKSGDHLLMVDTVYNPGRLFCDSLLKDLGVETTYYDPLIGAGITAMIRPNTRVVYCESPGSQTMEIQDIPAIAESAKKAGCIVVMDNTWSAGHYFKAFEMGCDISLQAATKYLVGHSDAMMGCVTCNEKTWDQFKHAYETMGQFAGPDDMYLTLRGIRTLDVRLERHQRNATHVAEWLRTRPEVETVLYPALSNAPGHSLWKRDYKGASGLFSVILKPASDTAVAALLDDLELFGMGYSWGGYESLVVPFHPHRTVSEWTLNATRPHSDGTTASDRTAINWTTESPALRFHIGLENPDDLIADLTDGFARMKTAG